MTLDPISYKKAKDAEKLAQSVIDGEFDLGVARTKIDEKLNDLEEQYAPQLNDVTAQLAQKTDEVDFIEHKDVTQLAILGLDAKIDNREPPEPIIIENLWVLEETVSGILSVSNGTLNVHHSARATDFIDAVAGEDYTISSPVLEGATPPTIQFVEYDENQGYIQGQTYILDDERFKTITLTENTHFIRVSVNVSAHEIFVLNIGGNPMDEDSEGEIWDGGFWKGIPTPPLREGSVKTHHLDKETVTAEKLSVELRERIESGTTNNKTYIFSPSEIIGYYRPSDNFNYAELQLNASSTSLQDYYDKYDVLINNNSDYFTRQVFGKDASGLYDVLHFTLKPFEVGSNLTKTIPKIAIVCGTHGAEKNSQFSLYYFIRDLCENWEGNPSLEYLRWNVEIQLIPCANPWAFENGTGRKNYNGVDLNRNFDEGWKFVSDPESPTYAGTEPFSEVETQYIKSFIDSNADALFIGDYHNHFTQPPDYFIWHALPTGLTQLNEPIEIASVATLRESTLKIAKNYDLEVPLTASRISYALPDGKVRDYAAAKGIPSLTMECFPYLNMTTYATSIQASTEYTGNWFLNILRTFKDRY